MVSEMIPIDYNKLPMLSQNTFVSCVKFRRSSANLRQWPWMTPSHVDQKEIPNVGTFLPQFNENDVGTYSPKSHWIPTRTKVSRVTSSHIDQHRNAKCWDVLPQFNEKGNDWCRDVSPCWDVLPQFNENVRRWDAFPQVTLKRQREQKYIEWLHVILIKIEMLNVGTCHPNSMKKETIDTRMYLLVGTFYPNSMKMFDVGTYYPKPHWNNDETTIYPITSSHIDQNRHATYWDVLPQFKIIGNDWCRTSLRNIHKHSGT